MKKYTLTILDKELPNSPYQIEGDHLVELMSKLLILIAQLNSKEKLEMDDDIPF